MSKTKRLSVDERFRLKERIYEAVTQAKQPLSVDAAKTRAKAQSWHLVLNLLFELESERKIVAIKTTKSWIFCTIDKLSRIKNQAFAHARFGAETKRKSKRDYGGEKIVEK